MPRIAAVVTLAALLGLTSVAFAGTTALAPVSYTTVTGADGGQPVTSLRVRDQSDVQNDWAKYVELTPGGATRYEGYRRYVVPARITPSSITRLRVKANYLGALRTRQRWTWSIYNWRTRAWVVLGDNAKAADWRWTLLAFDAPGSAADYVKSATREIRVRLKSGNALDDADLDYEAVVLTVPDVWRPAPNTSWQWQLTGLPLDQTVDAQVYDVDLFETSASVVASLHAAGRKVICYMSAGSWEDWRPDAGQFPAAVLGATNGWPGERWLDIRRLDVLGPIMEARLDRCKSKGFDAVEPDNVDGYANRSGFPLTYADQLRYNIFLARAAHARGLSIGLKNDLDQVRDLEPYFDWALNEECFSYDECEMLQPFVDAGKAVFHVEYELPTSAFCARANAMNFNSLKKRWDLDAWRRACR
ncbi:MAG: endo alpha-1,4 polygalactosaminidase [Candidatus Rokubacteria bacterium]|nr:endo alpha-1,4 polygalactosaminidase [Candidatus Rokubacteria bacterium]